MFYQNANSIQIIPLHLAAASARCSKALEGLHTDQGPQDRGGVKNSRWASLRSRRNWTTRAAVLSPTSPWPQIG